MLKELLVKQDVVDERVTAFDLDALDIESVTVCGLVDVPHKTKDKIELDSRIATLAIGADGGMRYASHSAEDGPEDEIGARSADRGRQTR